MADTCELKHEALDKFLDVTCQKVNQRFEHMDDALKLRTTELDRRLDELNHWRTLAISESDKFLEKKYYDDKTRFYDGWMAQTNDRLMKIETSNTVWVGFGITTVINIIIIVLFHVLGK